MQLKSTDNSYTCAAIVCVSLCLSSLIYSYGCYGFEAIIDESPDFNGRVCNEEVRAFNIRCPSVIACAFECRKDRDCIGSSFIERESRCIGCLCESVRNESKFTNVDGANFFIQSTKSLFTGQCGIIADKDVTAEYMVNTGQTTSVLPSIRVNSQPSWAPEEEETYFLKINFRKMRLMYKLITQGRNNNGVEEYVTSYSVFISNDCDNKEYLATFEGNSNAGSLKKQVLDSPILTKCIYFKPELWTNHPSMRIDILGF